MSDPFALDAAQTEQTLGITDSAAARIMELLEAEKDDSLMLRVTVSGGGCSGFQYGFSFDADATPDDLVFENGTAKVVTDKVSMDLLAGSEIDYVDDLIGAFFKINNPNATSSCGCGTSFSV